MRIAIASPERLFLDGLLNLLTVSPFHVIAAGTDLRACAKAAHAEQVDLFICDLHRASESDIEFLLGALSFGEIRALMITDGAPVPNGFELTASRLEPAQALVEKVRKISSALPTTERRRSRPPMMTHGFQLSNREYEVACLIAKGFNNRKISETMALKEQSVKNLVSTVIRKLHCENRVQVALRLSGPAAD